jgi:hypothetical protein
MSVAKQFLTMLGGELRAVFGPIAWPAEPATSHDAPGAAHSRPRRDGGVSRRYQEVDGTLQAVWGA